MIIKICENCRKKFKAVGSNKNRQKYCCGKCWEDAREEKLRKNRGSNDKNDYIKCELCGELIFRCLIRHIRKKHNMSTKTYHKKVGKKTNIYCKNILKTHKGFEGKHHTEETKKKSRESNIKTQKGRTLEQIHGIKKAKQLKYQMSKLHTGMKRSEETRRKLREAAIKRVINHNGIGIGYNENTIPILKEFKEKNNLKNCYFAENPKEYQILGYSLDFIDFDIKLIIEIDEKHHEKPKQKIKDKIRQKEIQEKYPDFRFLRFKEKDMNKILEIKC